MVQLTVTDIHIIYTVHMWQTLGTFALPWIPFSNLRFKHFNII